jgi:DNA-binding transcriptional ArsR family regulator
MARPTGGGPLPVVGPIVWSPPMSDEASTLLGLLADDDRLRTVAALVLGSGPASASEVATAAGLDIRRAAKALTRLA